MGEVFFHYHHLFGPVSQLYRSSGPFYWVAYCEHFAFVFKWQAVIHLCPVLTSLGGIWFTKFERGRGRDDKKRASPGEGERRGRANQRGNPELSLLLPSFFLERVWWKEVWVLFFPFALPLFSLFRKKLPKNTQPRSPGSATSKRE